jgi:hypothetical protein
MKDTAKGWVCQACGIEASDHGYRCGERISEITRLDPQRPDTVTPDERSCVATLCYMLRDVARRYANSRLAKDDEEFERLIGYLNLPPDVMFQAIQRETSRSSPAPGGPPA